jgi:hypothetical protein
MHSSAYCESGQLGGFNGGREMASEYNQK